MRTLIPLAIILAATLAAAPFDARPSERVAALLQRADAERTSDPKAFSAALEQLNALRREATPGQVENIDLLAAYQAAFQGRFVDAISMASRLNEATRDPAVKLRSSLLVANSAAATRDFSLGLKHLEIAQAMTGESDIAPELRQRAYAVSAILYNQLGDFEQGLRYADALLADPGIPRQRCVAKQLRLEALLGLERWPSDEESVNEAIADCEGQQERVFANAIRIYKARNAAAHGDYATASDVLSSHVEEIEASGYSRLIAEFHALLADYRLAQGDLPSASRHAHQALEASRNNAFSLPRVIAYKVLYDVASRRGETARALEFYREYADADKAYLDDVKTRELAVQQSRNEVQQKDQAIALLSKQNEVLKLEQEVSRKSAQNTRLLMLLLGVVLAAIGYWAYKIKRVQVAFRRQAQTDGLTGISNRRHFRDEADALLRRCAESGREAALVLLDLDNFKHVNDRHGHAAGDWVLKQVADACKAVCRDGDLCGRLGGEEFGILSCGGDADAARRIADRCREQLADIDGGQVGLQHPVTASFGCTTARASGYAFETMFSDADSAMYRAKNSGRDRVEMHGTGGSPPLAASTVEPAPLHG